MSAEPGPLPPVVPARRSSLVPVAAGAVVVVAVAIGGAWVMGGRHGDADGKNVDVIKARREMLQKIAKSASDSEAQARQLGPEVQALADKEKKLAADNAAALAELQAHWVLACGAEHVRFTAPRPGPPSALPLGEVLREEYPCGTDGQFYDGGDEPKVSLDVVDFGEFVGGPCDGARLVRTTVSCSYTSFDQNCAGDSDGCERFNPPEPTWHWNEDWGCIHDARTPGGGGWLDTADHCAPDDDVGGETELHRETAHLFWALRGAQAVFLSEPSIGWDTLGEAEPAPGARHEAELKLVFRVDDTVKLDVEELPEAFDLGDALVADDDERFDANVPGAEGGEVGTDVVTDLGDGTWRRVTRDGRARTYREKLTPTQDFSHARDVKAGVVIGGEHICTRTRREPADEPALIKVGQDGTSALYVEHVVVDGDAKLKGQPVILWASNFGNLWSCNNRAYAPYPSESTDPPWEDPTTDEDRENFPWCFR